MLLCRRLTAAAHARYLKGNTFYTVAQLAGKQACCPDVAHHCQPAVPAMQPSPAAQLAAVPSTPVCLSLKTCCTSRLFTLLAMQSTAAMQLSKAVSVFPDILHAVPAYIAMQPFLYCSWCTGYACWLHSQAPTCQCTPLQECRTLTSV